MISLFHHRSDELEQHRVEVPLSFMAVRKEFSSRLKFEFLSQKITEVLEERSVGSSTILELNENELSR